MNELPHGIASKDKAPRSSTGEFHGQNAILRCHNLANRIFAVNPADESESRVTLIEVHRLGSPPPSPPAQGGHQFTVGDRLH